MKIYTKTGDAGETGLLGGVRVRKTHLAIETCGALDETNSMIGFALSQDVPRPLESPLVRIQNDLFDLGSRVAASGSDGSTGARPADFSDARVLQLEQWIDEFQPQLPRLQEFILPGGCPAGATLHLARTVCRRGERNLVALIESGVRRSLSTEAVYLNRLGDLIFVFARIANQLAGTGETVWSATR